jgi:hypothetical protein
MPRHVTRLVASLVIDYSTSRRLVVDNFASGCLSTSRGSSRGSSRRSSSTTPPRAGLSSTTSPTPRDRVPRNVARLVVDYSASRRLVVDYFASAARPGCLGTSRGSSRGSSCCSSSTTPSRVRVPRHVARLVTRIVARLVVDYFAYVACLGASARRAAHRLSSTTSPTSRDRVPQHVTQLVAQARRRLRRLRRASGCLGTSRDPSHGSSSTTPCAATSSCGHAGSTSATSCVVTTCLAATLTLLRVRRAPPRRHLSVASRRPFISTSFPN